MSILGSSHSRLLVVAAVAMIAVAAACGGSAPAAPSKATTAPAAAAPKAAATAAPKAAATAAASKAAPAPSAATAAAASGGAAATAADAQLALGREIFEKTAGGVGCAFCHGIDGNGNGPAGVGAPPNRGADEARVRTALNDVQLMQIVKLSDAEIKAVVAYLGYLGNQP